MKNTILSPFLIAAFLSTLSVAMEDATENRAPNGRVPGENPPVLSKAGIQNARMAVMHCSRDESSLIRGTGNGYDVGRLISRCIQPMTINVDEKTIDEDFLNELKNMSDNDLSRVGTLYLGMKYTICPYTVGYVPYFCKNLTSLQMDCWDVSVKDVALVIDKIPNLTSLELNIYGLLPESVAEIVNMVPYGTTLRLTGCDELASGELDNVLAKINHRSDLKICTDLK